MLYYFVAFFEKIGIIGRYGRQVSGDFFFLSFAGQNTLSGATGIFETNVLCGASSTCGITNPFGKNTSVRDNKSVRVNWLIPLLE